MLHPQKQAEDHQKAFFKSYKRYAHHINAPGLSPIILCHAMLHPTCAPFGPPSSTHCRPPRETHCRPTE